MTWPGGSIPIHIHGKDKHDATVHNQIFVPYNGKIADITHADTNKHLLTLANAGGTGAIAGETRKIIAVSFTAN